MNSGLNAIHAYLLNVEDFNRDDEALAGPSMPISTNQTRNMTSPDPPTSQSPAEPVSAAELTQEVHSAIQFSLV